MVAECGLRKREREPVCDADRPSDELRQRQSEPGQHHFNRPHGCADRSLQFVGTGSGVPNYGHVYADKQQRGQRHGNVDGQCSHGSAVDHIRGPGIASKISPASNPFSLGHMVGNRGPATTLFIYNRDRLARDQQCRAERPGISIASNNCTSSPTPYGCSIQLTFAPTVAGVNNGSLVISSNDPVTPKLTVALVGTGDSAFAVPVLTSVSTPTVLIGTDTKVEVQGNNFYPESIAYLGGTALTNNFTDNSGLEVTIRASAISRVWVTSQRQKSDARRR